MAKNITNILSSIIQVQDKLNKKISNFSSDYTSFEVFATDKIIPSGYADTNEPDALSSVANLFNFDNTTATDLTYPNAVPSGMAMQMTIESDEDRDKTNLKIDWGDGTVYKIKDMIEDPTTINGIVLDDSDPKEYTGVNIIHTYTKPGKYMVKIFGPHYQISTSDSKPNIMSRILQIDMKISSTLTRFSSFCRNSNKILKVNVPETYNFSNIKRISTFFNKCPNLQSIYFSGFANRTFSAVERCQYIVQNCPQLTSFSFRIPSSAEYYCALLNSRFPKLNLDVLNILPQCGFKNKYIQIACFLSSSDYQNPQFTCSDYEKLGDYLWNNNNSTITQFSSEGSLNQSFTCCSKEFRSHVPTSWGGTGSDDELIILNKLQKKLDEIN